MSLTVSEVAKIAMVVVGTQAWVGHSYYLVSCCFYF